MKRSSKRREVTKDTIIPVSEFKARCLEILETLRRGGRELIVTKHGEPMARVVPIDDRAPLRGLLKGQLEIVGDIVQVDFSDDWEAVREPSAS